LCLSTGARAERINRLSTVSLPENGHQEDGGVILGIHRTCTYTSYQYQIDPDGQLYFKENATCQGNNAQQAAPMSQMLLVCQLDAALRCVASSNYKSNNTSHDFTGLSYSASKQGLSANGVMAAWENPQQASQVLPEIRSGAARNTKGLETVGCTLAFDGVVNQFRKQGHIPTDGNSVKAMRSCVSKFKSICADPQTKAQALAMTSGLHPTAVNPDQGKIDINAQDVDNFCGAIQKD